MADILCHAPSLTPQSHANSVTPLSEGPHSFCVALVVLSAVELVACSCFIVKVETTTNENLLSPFNVTLVSMICSLLIAFSFRVPMYFEIMPSYLDFFNTFFTAIFETSYLFYSWKRAEMVVERVLPSLVPLIRFLVYSSPLICALQAIAHGILVWYGPTLILERGWPAWWQVAYITQGCSYAAGALSILVDCFLLAAFITYLRSTVTDKETVDPRFIIISIFGVGSVSCLTIGLAFYYRYNVTRDDYQILITYLFLFLTSLVLFCMKIALNKEKVRKIRQSESVREKGLQAISTDLRVRTATGGVSVLKDSALEDFPH